jgi:phage terminase small subunit
MAVLKNTRHEAFAQALARGANQTEAYVLAGYDGGSAATPNAARLITNDKVKARVAELKVRAANRTEISVASITERLLSIADKGEAKAENPAMLAVARASLMDAAKLNGLVTDKAAIEANVNLTKIERAIVNAQN